jgi:hypothetical protein
MYEIKAESLCNANFSPTIFIIMIKIYTFLGLKVQQTTLKNVGNDRNSY